MTGRILIVDAVPTNRIVLRVKLAAAFYDVVQAGTAEQALSYLRGAPVDLVILSNNLPDMSGAKLCAALRRLPQARRLPLIALLTDDAGEDRRACLLAGADDVLSRPLDDLILLARVRSLHRARDAEIELGLHDGNQHVGGLAEAAEPYMQAAAIVLTPASDSPALLRASADLAQTLGTRMNDKITVQPWDALLRDKEAQADVIVVIEAQTGTSDGLSLLPQLRTHSGTRHAALHYVAHGHQRQQAAAALDIGAADVSTCGLEPEELSIRLRKLIARKKTADKLRDSMRDGLRAAIIDPLTGLYNRRYALPYLDNLANRAQHSGRGYAVLLADIDHFKTVNDTHGHAAGDRILADIAKRMREALRGSDLLARFGGEEFLIALPEVSKADALRSGERLCQIVAATPFTLPDGTALEITVSVGVALSGPPEKPPQSLVESADLALYAAKDKGRNTVVLADTVTPLIRPGRSPGAARVRPGAVPKARSRKA